MFKLLTWLPEGFHLRKMHLSQFATSIPFSWPRSHMCEKGGQRWHMFSIMQCILFTVLKPFFVIWANYNTVFLEKALHKFVQCYKLRIWYPRTQRHLYFVCCLQEVESDHTLAKEFEGDVDLGKELAVLHRLLTVSLQNLNEVSLTLQAYIRTYMQTHSNVIRNLL